MENLNTNKILYSITTILIITIFLALANPRIIGHVTESQYEEHIDQINKKFTTSTNYVWQPKHPGKIISVKISGEFTDTGQVTVYFEESLLLDKDTLKTTSILTGNTISENSEENITATNETNEENTTEIINQTNEETTENITIENKTQEENITATNETSEENTTEIINQTNEETTENIIIENKTQEENITIINDTSEEKAAITEENISEEIIEPQEDFATTSFEDICEKTCSNNNIEEKNSYKLKINLYDSQIKITEIKYKTEKQIEKQEDENTYTQTNSTHKNSSENQIITEKINTTTKDEVKKTSKIENKEINPIEIVKIAISIIALIAIVVVIIKNNSKKKSKKKSSKNKKRRKILTKTKKTN